MREKIAGNKRAEINNNNTVTVEQSSTYIIKIWNLFRNFIIGRNLPDFIELR